MALSDRRTLKGAQTEAIKRMLNLNVELQAGGGAGAGAGAGWGEQWKLLIYDSYGRDVISPLMNVNELRKHGVTLHMLLDSDREEIPDVPCIYFVLPTAANVRRIAADCAARLYTSVHLNFASPLPRPLLEELAKSSVASDSVGAIAKIYDQALDFVCLEPQLFSLNQRDSYIMFNDPAKPETAIMSWMDRIVQGLFSAVATFGALPIIRAPRGGVAEHIATKLHEMLRAHTQGRGSLFPAGTTGSSFHRPVLVLLQRDHDLITAVHHTATYQALVDDLLSLNMNRVTLDVEGAGRKSYDLNPETDAFYGAFAGKLFPEAIEANAEQLAGVTRQEQQIRAQTAGGGGGLDQSLTAQAATSAGEGGGANALMGAVTSLPALMEKKKGLEQHTAILQATMDLVMAREVPMLHELSDAMVRTAYLDKPQLLEALAGPGTLRDKVRVLTVCYIATEVTAADMEELEAAVTSSLAPAATSAAAAGDGTGSGAASQAGSVDPGLVGDLKVLAYIKKYKANEARMRLVKAGRMSNSQGGAAAGGTASSDGGLLSGKFMNMAKDVTSNLSGQAQGLLAKAAAGVKTFLPSSKQLYATKVVSAICEDRDSPETEGFLYLDPKIKVTRGQAAPRHRGPLREAVVFMIGGGNYTEYQNLQQYAQKQKEQGTKTNITYGCTELLNAEKFLEQLATLGA